MLIDHVLLNGCDEHLDSFLSFPSGVIEIAECWIDWTYEHKSPNPPRTRSSYVFSPDVMLNSHEKCIVHFRI